MHHWMSVEERREEESDSTGVDNMVKGIRADELGGKLAGVNLEG